MSLADAMVAVLKRVEFRRDHRHIHLLVNGKHWPSLLMSGIDWAGTMPDRLTPAEVAERALEEKRAVFNSPYQQPMFLWTWRPFTTADLKDAIEAGGHAPYRVLCGWEEPRGLQVPGYPEGATHCYLLVVEILARVA